MSKVTFLPMNVSVDVENGTTLLDAQRIAGLHPDAPCGGMGTCGKCLVDIVDENGKTTTVKSCVTVVQNDIVVRVPEKGTNLILHDGFRRDFTLDPPIKTARIDVKKGSLTDLRSEWDRIKESVCDVFNLDTLLPNLSLANAAPDLLKENNYSVEAVVYGNELLVLRKAGRTLAAAVDIGTTTVVLYLLDCSNGSVVATHSMMNPQTEFGADVILRANYAIKNGVEHISHVIRTALNSLLDEALAEIGAKREEVFSITVVGNTCMHHLLLGLDPKTLVLSPYYPAISEALVLRACDYDISIHPNGKLVVLPCIAGFVGADTAGVMLTCEMDSLDTLTLAVDIGTNGEMVLADADRAIACSTAAGPAFEGAKIACGTRGIDGAINHVALKDGDLSFTTIRDASPIGICGSGLMDLVAVLLDAGLVDETGRILDEDELESDLAVSLYPRIREIDGFDSFVVYEDANTVVYLSQKDIREVQLAKGALAAGIHIMLSQFDRKVSDIETVYIAGAFGSYMSASSACRIGLIPPELESKITVIGNAAGEGAKMAALSSHELQRVCNMVKNTDFVELAASPDFQDCFVEELSFPEFP